ncbi:MAG: sensor hybrid histidine kinase [Paenibacillaceae bacterium]|nr:sensor hybrid histidine kinase [Paenibacillaceae bacterium]
MTFRNRLIAGFSAILLLITIFSALVYYLGDTLDTKLDNIVNDRYAKVRLGEKILSKASQIQNHINLTTLNPNLSTIDQHELQLLSSQIHEDFEHLENLTRLTEGKAFLRNSQASFDLYEEKFKEVTTLANEDGGLNDNSRLLSVYNLEVVRKSFAEDMGQYISFQEDVMMTTSNESKASIERSKQIIVGFWLLLVFLSLLIGSNVMRGALRSINRISSVMDDFEAGHQGALPRITIEEKDEISDIAVAYNRMADALEEREAREKEYQQELEVENWIKTNLAEVASIYQDNRDLAILSDKLLSKIVPLAGASCASLYVMDPNTETPVYVRTGTYAWDIRSDVQSSFVAGEGLVGQCVKEGKLLNLQVPEHYIRVFSGAGSAQPNQLIFLPICHNGEVIAVLELVSFQPIEDNRMAFLTEITNHSLGTSIRNLQYQKHVEQLFSDSQTYNEELQVQSEELLQQQEALRSLNERLEEQVKISEMNSRYKSEFLANMSHELRTPLNSILVLAQILRENKDGNMSSKQREYADTMVMSGNQLLNLINDILDLSKIEAGQMTLLEESFDLQEPINELNQQFLPMMDRKGLTFNLLMAEDLKFIHVNLDKQRLLQILRNLLSNALKFTESGSVSLRVFIHEEEPFTLGFEVTDTGIGISQENQMGIFEAFRQVESNTSRKFGGTGLGLAISQELASLMGGSITVKSSLHAGSTFLLTIPVDGTYCTRLQESAAALEPSQLLMHMPDQTFSILLVDDDMRNIYSLSAVLEEYNYRVICAANGEEALSMLETEEVDLVLMDIMMPDMDGYEAMRIIRQSPAFGKIPIIALTAKAMKEDRDLCIEAGADDYISKPVRLDKLLSIIQVWLPGRNSS